MTNPNEAPREESLPDYKTELAQIFQDLHLEEGFDWYRTSPSVKYLGECADGRGGASRTGVDDIIARDEWSSISLGELMSRGKHSTPFMPPVVCYNLLDKLRVVEANKVDTWKNFESSFVGTDLNVANKLAPKNRLEVWEKQSPNLPGVTVEIEVPENRNSSYQPRLTDVRMHFNADVLASLQDLKAIQAPEK
ncbi:MAG: hypothetical protein NT141_01165 [candidate division WWE3 bacterium]|nr:hypothetical protein [candidate division WWE3 bacterium]